MSEFPGEQEEGQGDASLWDERWKAMDVTNATHYTGGRLETVAQLENRGYFEGIWSELSINTSKTCVELGAGRGNQALYLTTQGADVTMVDLSAAGFDLARTHFSREGLPTPTMIIADVRETGIPASTADMVYSIGLLEHFKDPLPVLLESHRILKPGGLLHHIVVPEARFRNQWLAMMTLNPPRFIVERAKNFMKRLLRYPPRQRKGTITAFGVQEYSAWLDELGFEDVSVVPINPYHPVHYSTWSERHIAMPIYRAHYAFKRRHGTAPNLATWSSVARSLLVRGRKPGPVLI